MRLHSGYVIVRCTSVPNASSAPPANEEEGVQDDSSAYSTDGTDGEGTGTDLPFEAGDEGSNEYQVFQQNLEYTVA